MSESTHLTKQPETGAQEIHERPAVAPAVDIFENQDEYLVVADLPGVTEDDVKIDLHNGELSLRAVRNAVRDGELLAREFEPVDYRRVFRIPDVIDGAKIEAKLRQGVLTLHLPKSESIKPRSITVRAG